MSHPVKCAIIGAGITGLRLAAALRTKADVQVFEKSRGFGGRMSTRRADEFQFDHGAQYFTAHSTDFERFLAPFIGAGHVARWQPRLATLGRAGQPAPVWTAPRYVAVPGMNALCKAMAEEIDVTLATRIGSITRKGVQWQLASETGEDCGLFDWVISTAPAEQTVRLMPAGFAATDALRAVKMQGCYSLMVGIAGPLKLDWDAAHVLDSPVAWVAQNQTKQGRAAGASLICQTRNDWAEAHLEDDQESVRDGLLEELARLTGCELATPAYLSLHRWRFAKVERPADQPFLIDEDQGLAATGDWCGSGRVETGFDNAGALAKKVLNFI